MTDGMHYWNRAMHAIPIQLSYMYLNATDWQSYLIWFDECVLKSVTLHGQSPPLEQFLPHTNTHTPHAEALMHLKFTSYIWSRGAFALKKGKCMCFLSVHGYALSVLCIGVVCEDEADPEAVARGGDAWTSPRMNYHQHNPRCYRADASDIRWVGWSLG